jgi:CRISPR/Cas system-associated exonuclease Cas4 (RecB family)
MMTEPTAQKLWNQAFTDEIVDAQANAATGVRWSTAGRTKYNEFGEDENWWRKSGPPMVQKWMDWRSRSDWDIWVTPEGKPAIEIGLIVPMGGVNVKMFLDRVFQTSRGHLIIVDLKSGKRTPESDLQLGFYSAGLQVEWGVEVFGGAYWMAREGKMTEIQTLDHYTPALLGHYAQQMRRAIDNEIFLPKPSMRCRSCGVRDYCASNGGLKAAGYDPDHAFITGSNTSV